MYTLEERRFCIGVGEKVYLGVSCALFADGVQVLNCRLVSRILMNKTLYAYINIEPVTAI